jgi:IclR family acetate operon transcriptional repressor
MSGEKLKAESATRGQYRTRALLRGLALLACFKPSAPELTLAELAEGSDLKKATAFRLLTSLVDTGFLRRDSERNTYQVGAAVLPIASAFQESEALAALAEPRLRRLADETGQTATLALADNGGTVNLSLAYPDRPLRRMTYVGERHSLHSTATGKAIAAALRDGEVEALLEANGMNADTPNTIVTWEAFNVELDEVRRMGWAFDDEEAILGVRCVGAAILDYTGRPVAAVSVAGATGEYEGEAIERLAREVMAVADSLSRELGHVPHDQVSLIGAE